ncbi:MAG: glutathione S-transferase family protein [Pseudomonadota bacterium]
MADSEITLFTLGGAFGMRNVSPFCFKTELLLTHLDQPFTLEVVQDPRKAPKGKLPYIRMNGVTVADSELIMAHLDRVLDGRVYGGLSPQQAAYGTALTRLAEEHLYWLMVASRWLDDDWFPNVVTGFFGIAPALIRPLVAAGARRQAAKTYDLQGLGRHSPEEQRAFAHADLRAIEQAVGDGPFLFGTEPTVHDFAVAAVLTGIFYNEPATWLTRLAEPYEGLRQYVDQVERIVGISAR